MEYEIKIKGDLFEESETFKIFNSAQEMHSALWDGLQTIRSRMKHEQISDEEYEFLERLREDLHVTGIEMP